MLYHLPYGKTEISVEIPEKYNVNIIRPNDRVLVPDEKKEIDKALSNPVKSKRLSEIATPVKKAVIIVSDSTRPTPTSKLLPPLISELNAGGIEDVTVVFGLGIHRKQTEDEKKNIIGTQVEVFRPVAEADIVICTGTIEFHYYAGYSGGAKSILPAVSSKRSIYANHALMLDPKSSAGRLDGNVRNDIEEAGTMLGIDFILNVVLNEKKEILFAVAGDYIAAHRKGVEFLDRLSKIKVEQADIIIVSPGGWPKDIDIFQSHKALEHVKNAMKDDGSMILVAECSEGYGNRVYEEWLKFNRDEAIEKFKAGFVMGGHKAALIAALSKKVDLYLVSTLPDDMARRAYFIPATLEGALNMALQKHGSDAKILVIPYGGSMLVAAISKK